MKKVRIGQHLRNVDVCIHLSEGFLQVWNGGRGADDHALGGDELVDVCHKKGQTILT